MPYVSARRNLSIIIGIMMLCAALVNSAGAQGHNRHHSRGRNVSIRTVRQTNVIGQSNSNTFNVVAVGGSVTATCSPTNGNNSAMATGAGGVAIAANANFCAPTATGGAARAVNTGRITQTGTNTATATNRNTR